MANRLDRARGRGGTYSRSKRPDLAGMEKPTMQKQWSNIQGGASTPRSIRWSGLIALVLACILGGPSAWATVTAYTIPTSTPYTYGPNSARLSHDGVVLSPFFNVTAGGTPVYVYNTEVRSVVFPDLASGLTGQHFSATGTGGYGGTNTSNLGTASFTSFQASGTNTVLVTFQPGYPTSGTLTSASQVNILGRVTSNLSGVTVYPAGNAQGYPAGSFSFDVTSQVDASGNGIPQQLTVEIEGDWLNSLHVFINPAPNSTNGVPTGAYTMTPGTITGSSFPSGQTVFYFPHGIYNFTGNVNFGVGAELYLDDGAFLNFTGSTTTTLPMVTMGGYNGAPAQNAIVRGWGVLDGQSMQSQLLNASTPATCTTDKQLIAPMCQPAAGVTPGRCASNSGILAFSDMNTSSTRAVLVDGVILRNSCTYNFYPAKNVGSAAYPITVNNIKILGYSGNDAYEGNSDGIDVVTDQYMNITNSFFRTMDDLISLKQTSTNYFPNATYPNPNCTAGLGIFPTAAINVVGNTFWNEYAHSMVVGGELYNGCNVNQYSNPLAVDDVLFDSNIVIHDTGKSPQMSVLNIYGGKVQNVVFSNNRLLQETAVWGYYLSPNSTTSNPGIMGGSQLCNITAAAQSPQMTFGGTQAEPFVGPIPNFQMAVALPYNNPYVGNGTQSGTYPQAVQYGPQMYNVVVNGTTVSSSIDGNDYYYKSPDGSSHGDGVDLISQSVVELTEKIRLQTNTQYSIWQYNSGIAPESNYVPGDMMAPQFTTLTCPVSSLLPVAH